MKATGGRGLGAALATALFGSLVAAGSAESVVQLERAQVANVSVLPLERVAVGDVDGDGLADVAVSGRGGLSLLYGDPGTLLAVQEKVVPADRRPVALAIGDLDADGLGDIAISARGLAGNPLCSPCTAVRYGAARGKLVHARRVFAERAEDLAIGPFSGDAVPDLIGTPPHGGTLLLGRGVAGQNPTPASVFVGDGRAHKLRRMAVGDLDGDGRADDLAIADTGARTVHIVLDQGTADVDAFQRVASLRCCPPGFRFSRLNVAAGDVNGDGRQDIVVSDPSARRTAGGIFLGVGGGAFSPIKRFAPSGHGAATLAVADLDADGRAEVLLGHADGTLAAADFGTGQRAEVDLGPRVTSVGVADLDGNGAADVVAGDFRGRLHALRTAAPAPEPAPVIPPPPAP